MSSSWTERSSARSTTPVPMDSYPEPMPKTTILLTYSFFSTDPPIPGTLVEVRPVGVLEMRDEKGLDHKILGVPISDPRKAEIMGLQDVPRHTFKEVDYFFHIYKDLEGKFADTYGWLDRMEAYRIIEECMQRYEDLRK